MGFDLRKKALSNIASRMSIQKGSGKEAPITEIMERMSSISKL